MTSAAGTSGREKLKHLLGSRTVCQQLNGSGSGTAQQNKSQSKSLFPFLCVYQEHLCGLIEWDMYRYVHKRAKSESWREAAVTIGSHNVSVIRSIIYIRDVDYTAVTEKGVETSVNVSPRLCVCV